MLPQQVIDGIDVTPKTGSAISGDNWDFDVPLELPEEGIRDLFGPEVFRVTSPHGRTLLVRVNVSGRKIRHRSNDRRSVRVVIQSVGDGEPDVSFGGWLVVA